MLENNEDLCEAIRSTAKWFRLTRTTQFCIQEDQKQRQVFRSKKVPTSFRVLSPFLPPPDSNVNHIKEFSCTFQQRLLFLFVHSFSVPCTRVTQKVALDLINRSYSTIMNSVLDVLHMIFSSKMQFHIHKTTIIETEVLAEKIPRISYSYSIYLKRSGQICGKENQHISVSLRRSRIRFRMKVNKHTC